MINASVVLREYQKLLSIEDWKRCKSMIILLLIAPTSTGKTIILSSLISKFIKQSNQQAKILVLQHRKEIIWQNMQAMSKIDRSVTMSLISQDSKDNAGVVVFAMIQTLYKNIKLITHFDLVVVAEAHHVVAPSFLKIIETVRDINLQAKVYGVIATPLRSDKKRLVEIFIILATQSGCKI